MDLSHFFLPKDDGSLARLLRQQNLVSFAPLHAKNATSLRLKDVGVFRTFASVKKSIDLSPSSHVNRAKGLDALVELYTLP